MRKVFFIIFVSFVSSTHSFAGYTLGPHGTVKTKKNHSSSTPFPSSAPKKASEDPETAVLADLSKRFSVPVDQLSYYRKIHYGYNELVPAMVIARDAQVEIGRVLKMKSSGKKWQQITESFSVDPNAVSQESERVLKTIRGTVPEKALTESPQTRG